MVLITQFTTVFPTDFVQATIAPSVSSTLTLVSTTATSSSAAMSSNVPDSTIPISSMIFSSQTLLPTSSATGSPLAPKQKFNDTFAYVSLAALIALAVLLIGMVFHLIYLRCKGECLHCRGLQQQLAKWESGKLMRITPLMVMKRDALNKAALSSNTSSYVDVEMGFAGREMFRGSTLDKHETNKEPTLFQKVKAKVSRKGKSPARNPGSPSADGIDRFFTVNDDAFISNPEPSRRTTALPPQAGYNADNLYATRYCAYPTSSVYSQATNAGRTDANGSRVFSDVWTPDIANMRKPLRRESDEPNPYTAYGPTDHDLYDSGQKERNIATALAILETTEYKDAESVLKRVSATDSETGRASSIVNLRDQQLNITRHSSAYTEAGLCLDWSPEAEVPARPESYRVLDWRKKGIRPPEPADVQEDFSPYLNQELNSTCKNM